MVDKIEHNERVNFFMEKSMHLPTPLSEQKWYHKTNTKSCFDTVHLLKSLGIQSGDLLTRNLLREDWVCCKGAQSFSSCIGLRCQVTVLKFKVHVAESVIANADVYSMKMEKILEESLAGGRQRDIYIKTYAELLIFSYQQNQTKKLRAQLRALLVQLVHASKITFAFSMKC